MLFKVFEKILRKSYTSVSTQPTFNVLHYLQTNKDVYCEHKFT